MSQTLDTVAIDRKTDELIERWFGVLSSTRTNHAMAVDAINSIYKRLGKNPPGAILWCESPFQMSVLPPLVTTIVQSNAWKSVVERMKSFEQADITLAIDPAAGVTVDSRRPGSKEWDSEFEKHWSSIKSGIVEKMAAKTYDHIMYVSVGANIKSAALDRLKTHLRSILLEGKVKPGSMVPDREKNRSEQTAAHIDFEFIKHILCVAGNVKRRTNLKLEGADLIISMSSAVFSGIWNPRLVTDFIPDAEKILGGAPNTDDPLWKSAAHLKAKCAVFERSANERFRWFLALLPQARPPQPEATEESMRTRVGFDAVLSVVNAVHDSFRTSIEYTKAHPSLVHTAGLYFPASLSWMPFALSLRFIEPDFLDAGLNEDIDNFAYLSHAAAGYTFCKNVCFVCSKPLVMTTTADWRLHNSDGPAVVWSDGLKSYAWKGTTITADVIEEKEKITHGRISQERNAEIRRVLMEIYGESRYLMDSNAKAISTDYYGTLYRLEFLDDEPLVMVRVKNSTPEPDGTYKYYFLRVPPTILTAREAVAWTFEMSPRDYRPNYQS